MYRIQYFSTKGPIRPVTKSAVNAQKPVSTVRSPSENKRTDPRVTPLGFAFVLGGLAFASYLFKPSTKMPAAAMDTFKPQIAIVFATGDSNGQFKTAAQDLGFQYVDVQKDMDKLDKLVKAGNTRFFIEGFKDIDEIREMEKNVVQPDLLLEFGAHEDQHEPASRLVRIKTSSESSIKEVLEKTNLI